MTCRCQNQNRLNQFHPPILPRKHSSPFISFQYPKKTGELLDSEVLVERSSRSGVSYDEAVSEIPGVKAGSPDTNSSKSVTFLESAGTKDTPGQVCGALSSPGFFVPCGLNRIHPSLTAVPSLCPLSVFSVTLSLGQGLSFRTCLHSSCSGYRG